MRPRASELPGLLLLTSVALTCACAGDETPRRDATPPLPQFEPLPDDSAGLVNEGASVEVILEQGALEGACERYASGETDRATELACGKWMFFYEGFGTAGVPAPIVDFELSHLEDQVGRGYSKLHMVPDPFSEKGYPLGLAPTAPFGELPALAFTCASCHFARLPDGRYSVGAPNLAYEYGKHVLSLLLPPFLGLGVAGDHDPSALSAVAPMVDAILADPAKSQALNAAVGQITQALSGDAGLDPGALTLTKEEEALYASWLPGTMDFMIAPLPVRDDAHTISKVSPLWELPQEHEIDEASMRHAMLGWTGGTASLMSFLRAFVDFGGGDPEAWPEERLRPLEQYIYSLRRPQAPEDVEGAGPGAIDRGRALFTSSGCNGCHDGPRGSGRDLYDYDAIGTDDAMKRWFDADLDGEGCCGAEPVPGDEITHRIKSPRLVGLWAMSRYLHNGSVPSLEALFCLDGPRPTVTELAYSDRGHTYTCDPALSPENRRDLIAFLRSL